MVNESNADVYQQIFAGVSSRSDRAHAIARAVRQLREALEKEDNCAVTAAHVRNLKEIDPAALALAYAMAEKTCTYWPTPGQIRELAGWSEETRGRAAPDIARLNRKGAARALDNRCIAKERCDSRAVERCRHDEKPQIRAQALLHVTRQGEPKVGVK